MIPTGNPAQPEVVWPNLPAHGAGQSIGLYGGSFNPPHEGHAHVSGIALRMLGLDRLWWLVTPGNPLKSHGDLMPLQDRMRAARRSVSDPRVSILSVEADIGVSRSLATVRWLKRRAPDARLVWVMGADNLAGFHKWYGWREIANMLPIAVIDRPGFSLAATASPAAHAFARYRMDEMDARLLPGAQPPAWVFLRQQLNFQSSSAIRSGTGSN